MAVFDSQTQDQAADLDQAGPTIETSRVRPDAHTQRYDRQLRLWAASGQTSLEKANVLLVGSSYLAASILKNLVLPGIGRFTIVDNAIAGAHDLGSNFFLDSTSIGKSRAAEVTRLLSELNPNVIGTYKAQSARSIIDRDPHFFASFTLVISVNQHAQILEDISQICWEGSKEEGAHNGIPLMAVRGAGLLGQCQVQVEELGIINTHPATLVSLRLLQPFPSLESFFDAFDLSDTSLRKMDSMERAHVPHIVLVGKALKEWRDKHGGHNPGSDSSLKWAQRKEEKDAFRSSLRTLQTRFRAAVSSDGGVPDLENFEEAEEALGVHVFGDRAAAKPSNELLKLLDDDKCLNPNDRSSNFWLLLAALRAFLLAAPASEPPGSLGVLPLPGALPDFKALTATYVQIQNIYRTKAAEDLQAIRAHLDEVLARVGLPADSIDEDTVVEFVKNAEFVHLVRGRRVAGVIPNSSSIIAAFGAPNPPGPTIQHHIIFSAADLFLHQHGRYPGASKTLTSVVHGENDGVKTEDALAANSEAAIALEEDTAELSALSMKLVRQWGALDETGKKDEVGDHLGISAEEFVRSGHTDLPSTAALLGGVAAQEAIKLITHQYVPLNNIAIYDGIRGTIGAFQL